MLRGAAICGKCFTLYIYTLNGLYLLSKRVVFALGHLCEAKLENKSRKSFVYHDHGFS